MAYLRQKMKRRCDPHEEFAKAFAKQHSGYILITCGEPSESGDMHVRMTYEGTDSLLQILLEGAQNQLEEDFVEGDACLRLVKS